jgi:hypothetical protein
VETIQSTPFSHLKTLVSLSGCRYGRRALLQLRDLDFQNGKLGSDSHLDKPNVALMDIFGASAFDFVINAVLAS